MLTKTNLWGRLIAPNPKLNPEEQRRARLLNIVTLSLAAIILVFLPLPQLSGFNLRITFFLLGGFACCWVTYGLTRFGQIKSGASLLTLFITGGTIGYIASVGNANLVVNLRANTPIIAIASIAAGVIIGPRFAFIVAAIGSIGVSIVAFVRRGPGVAELETIPQVISQLATAIFLLFVLAGLSWLFESNIQNLLSRLRSQNTELEVTNLELAHSREAERRLGQEINLLSSQVSNAFTSQTQGVANQLSAVVEVTSTLEELSQTNEQISQAAHQVADSARHTLQVAEQGSINIKQSLDATILLSERVQNMADAMYSLSEQARQVDQIIDLITEVAEETSLLALNATIEAAGAGEYGRRFAAVASEVQRLANRSHDATEQVRHVIVEVQDAIRSSAQVSQVGLQEASQIVGGALEAGHTIEEVVKMVEHTTTLAQQISVAIQHQRSASSQVVETMHQISEVSQEVASNSAILLQALNQLNQTADQLRAIATPDSILPEDLLASASLTTQKPFAFSPELDEQIII